MANQGAISNATMEVLCCLSSEPIMAKLTDIRADVGFSDLGPSLAVIQERFGLVVGRGRTVAIASTGWLKAEAAAQAFWDRTRVKDEAP